MTKTKRWLDELPRVSSEYELLLAGRSARPAPGAVDADWQALCVALGTGAVATSVAASSIAESSVAGHVSGGSSLVLGKASSAGLCVAAAKSLAIGVVAGLSVMGAGTLVERSNHGHGGPQAAAKPTLAATGQRPSVAPIAAPIAAHPDQLPAPSAPLPSASSAAFVAPPARSVESPPLLNQPGGPSPSSITSPSVETDETDETDKTDKTDKTASLSQQARELAQLKRLIDSGASSEALRRLDQNFSADATSALSEERDALYVQALDRAQRRAEARAFAQRFLARYPHSPYVETMRRLLAEE